MKGEAGGGGGGGQGGEGLNNLQIILVKIITMLNAFKCNLKELTNKSAIKCLRSAVFGMRMPSSWLHRSCDALARSVFLRAKFC